MMILNIMINNYKIATEDELCSIEYDYRKKMKDFASCFLELRWNLSHLSRTRDKCDYTKARG